MDFAGELMDGKDSERDSGISYIRNVEKAVY